ncbi:hypothetical protein [uncultured Psychroserpens sp.]|uniref:energy transducer TonB n=1 Tax=uncultured Psychroserpens sp. TaxID=255436 RepID=UPI00260511DC|nr:hypothetical protein [uncultured Psychroserpens sp.]
MKKTITISGITLIILCILVYGALNLDHKNVNYAKDLNNGLNPVTEPTKTSVNKNNQRFFYSVGNRYDVIKKSDLLKAKSIKDFLRKEQMPPLDSYQFISMIVVKDNKQTDEIAMRKTDKLSKSQIELLKSANFSTHILIRSDYENISEETLQTKYGYWCPHLTIVPEQQAKYIYGQDALVSYLEENGEAVLESIDENKFKSVSVYFTVTKEGLISNTRMESNSNHPKVDEKIIELITGSSGQWVPAKNIKGEDVDQELVFSLSTGC